jgi:hypothetical protein
MSDSVTADREGDHGLPDRCEPGFRFARAERASVKSAPQTQCFRNTAVLQAGWIHVTALQCAQESPLAGLRTPHPPNGTVGRSWYCPVPQPPVE